MTGRSYAITQGEHGPVIHTRDCPEARAQAAAGLPVLTLYDCERSHHDLDCEPHSCLEAAPRPRDDQG